MEATPAHPGAAGGNLPEAQARPLAGASLAMLAALTLAGLALRLRYVNPGLFGDELYAYVEVHGRSFGGMLAALGDSPEISPPLFFVLAWLADRVGDSPEALRLPSLVLGTSLIPLGFTLGRLTVGRSAGLVAAALIALSPFEIFYSTEARPYMTLAFFSVLSSIAVVMACRSAKRWSPWWLAVAACSALTMYSHYTGVFVLAAAMLWVIVWHRERIVPAVAAAALGAVAFLPWLTQVSSKGMLDVYGPFRPLEALRADLPRTLVGSPFIPLRQLPGLLPALAFFAAVAYGAIAWVLDAARNRRGLSANAGLIVLLALATPLGMLGASLVTGYDLISPRNVSASVPAAYIALAALLVAAPGRPRWLVPALAVAVFSVGAVKTLSPENKRADFRAAADFISSSWEPGSQILEIRTIATSTRPFIPYLKGKLRPVYASPGNFLEGFRKASATGSTVFVIYPDPALSGLTVKPPPPGPGIRAYRAIRTVVEPGIGGGVFVTEFAPVGAAPAR